MFIIDFIVCLLYWSHQWCNVKYAQLMERNWLLHRCLCTTDCMLFLLPNQRR